MPPRFWAEPDNWCVAVWQIVASFPAFATGVFRMISVLLSDAGCVQGKTAEAVNVKVTFPAIMSDVPGV